jgi:hypothetical protein
MRQTGDVIDPRDRARRELRLIRRDARQPWRRWPRRIGSAVVSAARATADFLKELVGEVIAETLVAVVALGLFGLVAALVAWGWGHSPVATVVLLAGLAVFLGYGGYELIGRSGRRRGRVAATAAGAAGFTVLWASYVAMYYVG